jgi:hypothetical protein
VGRQEALRPFVTQYETVRKAERRCVEDPRRSGRIGASSASSRRRHTVPTRQVLPRHIEDPQRSSWVSERPSCLQCLSRTVPKLDRGTFTRHFVRRVELLAAGVRGREGDPVQVLANEVVTHLMFRTVSRWAGIPRSHPLRPFTRPRPSPTRLSRASIRSESPLPHLALVQRRRRLSGRQK